MELKDGLHPLWNSSPFLKKAMEFDLQLQTKECVKSGATKEIDRAVLLVQSRCGCHIAKLQGCGPKRDRLHKKSKLHWWFHGYEACLNLIRECKNIGDDIVVKSNTVSQEEGSKVDPGSKRALQDVQNMPGEDSLSEHLEPALGAASATRYNSALDMTLKALLNIKTLKEDLMQNIQPFQNHLEEQVPSALQNFFTAFVSDVVKNNGLYSCLLSDLLASLEQVLSMWSDAAEVLVAVLEFLHCWKNPERESLVTCLFTLEEDERMS